MNAITIQIVTQEDLPSLCRLAENLKLHHEHDYFQRNFEIETRDIFVARMDAELVAYGVLNWAPKYVLYKKLGIPEIQDLNVLRDFRRRGVGRAMISFCEEMAVQRGIEQVGISVGLDASYGAAQRLYVHLGYVPDGNGVTYDRVFVAAGDIRPVDDDLCLMMVKDLAKTAA